MHSKKLALNPSPTRQNPLCPLRFAPSKHIDTLPKPYLHFLAYRSIPSGTNRLETFAPDLFNVKREMKGAGQRTWLLLLTLVLVLVVSLTTFFNIHSHVDRHSELEAERFASAQFQHRLRHRITQLETQLAALQQPSKNASANSPLLPQPQSQPPSFTTQLNRYHIRYWQESAATWPSAPLAASEKYVTFSPWRGGFNNIRMSLEMAVAAAFAMNRTLVMPPAYKMYLRGASSLESYFDFAALQRGISVVKYEEFLQRVPQFKERQGRKVPSKDDLHSTVERYYAGLRGMEGVVVHDEEVWGKGAIGESVVYCVPRCPERPTVGRGRAGLDAENYYFDNFLRRRKKTFNTEDLRDAHIIHFPENLLGHFYSMFWFQDPQKSRRMKRIVRDHVHFREEIVELAERVIERLGHFQFSCLHVRRNEFQFKDVWTPAEEIVRNVQGLFKAGEQIYISTDELSKGKEHRSFDPTAMTKRRKHSWFTPMLKAWGTDNVHFLDEYFDELLGPDVPKIWIGCIETSTYLLG